jgi:hypothetical protein
MKHTRLGTRPMARRQTRGSSLRLQILDVLTHHAVLELEDLVGLCSSYTWNQVFLEVDRLSRTGEVQLVYRGPGVYAVTLPARQAA